MKSDPTSSGAPLTDGQRAVPMYLQDLEGHIVTLDQYQGKTLLLCLYRSPDCPQCGLRLLHLVQAYPRLHALGLQILVIFEADETLIPYHIAPLFLPFPIVADPEHRVFQAYGVHSPWWGGLRGLLRIDAYWQAWRARVGGRITSGRLFQRPAEMLIGPDGCVQWAYYGNDIGDHLPLVALEAHLRKRVDGMQG